MIAAACSFALMAACSKMMPELPSFEKVFVRSVISVVLTLGMIRSAGNWTPPKRMNVLFWRAVFGFIGLSCYFEAIDRIPLGTAVTVYNMTPLFAAVVGLLFLREGLKMLQAVALMVGLGGVALIKGFTPELTWDGVLFALGTAFFSALAYSLVRVLNRTEHSLTIVLAFPLVSIPLSLIAGAHEFIWPQGMAWLWLLGLGLATQSGQVCLTHALKYHTASRATQIGFVGVIFAMLLGSFMGDGLPGWAQVLGAGLVFLSLRLGR